MPIRGERVGQAYVRIIADGSEIPQGIRDGLAEADDEVYAHGVRHSELYDEAFNDTYQENDRKRKRMLAEGLQVGTGRMNAIGKTMGNGLFDGLRDTLRRRLGGEDNTIADVIANNLIGDFKRTGNFDALLGQLEDLPRLVDDATKEVKRLEDQFNADWDAALKENERRNRAYLKLVEEAYAENERRKLADHKKMLDEAYFEDRQYNLRYQKLLNEAYQMNKDFDAKQRRLLEQRRMLEQAYAENHRRDVARIREEYNDLIKTVRELQRTEGGLSRGSSDITRRIRYLRAELDKIGGDRSMSRELERITKRLGTMHPRVRTLVHGLDELADGIGAVTGRGSRNNFLNFIGSLTRNFAKLAFIVPKAALTIGGDMVTAFQNASTKTGGLLAAVGALAPLMGQLALGIVGVVVAAGVLFVVMSPLVSLLSGLVAIVSALAASISFALIGAVSALAAVALPAVAALAVGLGGILSMSDKMKKKFADAFKPVIDGFKELGDVAGEVFVEGLQDQGERAADVLKTFEPIVRHIAQAIVDVGDSWLEMIEGKGFTQFVRAMDRFLPDAIRELGDIFAQTLGGFGGILRGMIPFMRDVLDYLDDITERFNDWANSAEGQDSIRRFFRRAEDSIASVAGWLDSVWDLLVTIIDAGKGTGDSIFDRMANNIDRFNQYLKDNPDALADWFSNAETLATKIGDIVVEIGELIDKLDSDEGRQALNDFLGWLTAVNEVAGPVADAINAITGAVDQMQAAGGGGEAPWWAEFLNNPADFVAGGLYDFFAPGGTFNQWINSFGDQLERLGEWIADLDVPNPFAGLRESFANFASGGRGVNMTGFFTGIPQAFANAVSRIDFRSLLNRLPSPSEIASNFAGTAQAVLDRIGDIPILRNFSFPSLGEISGRFVGLAGQILARMGNVNLLAAFDFPLLSEIASRFYGLAQAILNAIGTIDIGSLIDIPSSISVGGVSVGIGNPFGRSIVGGLPTEDNSLTPFTASGISGASSPRRAIDASGWTIVTPTEDPEAVATEVVNQLAAVGY